MKVNTRRVLADHDHLQLELFSHGAYLGFSKRRWHVLNDFGIRVEHDLDEFGPLTCDIAQRRDARDEIDARYVSGQCVVEEFLHVSAALLDQLGRDEQRRVIWSSLLDLIDRKVVFVGAWYVRVFCARREQQNEHFDELDGRVADAVVVRVELSWDVGFDVENARPCLNMVLVQLRLVSGDPLWI